MSSVLVIHPKDPTTEFLTHCYEGKGYDVIRDCLTPKEEIINQIQNHDKIIMMGHGTPAGLLNPKTWGYIIDPNDADLLSTKETISIWCNSDSYFRRYNIPGFHTGMIISETSEEAYVLGHIPVNKKDLLDNMNRFATIIGECIEESPKDMQKYVLDNYVGEDEVTQFNRTNIIVL